MDSDFLLARCHKCKTYTEQSYIGSYRNTVNRTMEHRYRCSQCRRLCNQMIVRESVNIINPYLPDTFQKGNKTNEQK